LPRFGGVDELAARVHSDTERWGHLIRSRLGNLPPAG